MNTAVVNVKVDVELKKQAQEIAHELGFSLSAVINASLKKLVRTKHVEFELEEKPNEYMIKALKESEEDLTAGRVSPAFDNADDAMAWLNNPHKHI